MNAPKTVLSQPALDRSPTPLVSLVIPVFNGEKYIKDCLQSVQAAASRLSAVDRDLVEIVFCDNHSTDNTYEVAASIRFVCPYRIIRPPQHYENRTMNWHCALSAARGTWMMMLHVDDLLAPQGLQTALNACRDSASASAVIISGRHRLFSEGNPPGRLHPIWPFPALISGNDMRKRVLPFECAFIPTTLMRRDTYQQVGGLDARYQLVQDWDLWIRLAALGDIYYSPHPMALWRQHGYPEKWACIFAIEHCALLCDLQRLIPDLPATTLAAAMDANMPRVMTWAPTVPLEDLIADLPAKDLILNRPRLASEQIGAAMHRRLNHIKRQLLAVRSAGTLRLLTQRRPPIDRAHTLSSSIDPTSKPGS